MLVDVALLTAGALVILAVARLSRALRSMAKRRVTPRRSQAARPAGEPSRVKAGPTRAVPAAASYQTWRLPSPGTRGSLGRRSARP